MVWRKWRAEEKKVEGFPLELIEGLSSASLVNFALLKAINKAMDDWQSIPYVVNVLESVAFEFLPKDYSETVEKIIQEADKLYPMWRQKEDQKIDRLMYIWNERLKIIIRELMKKGKRVYTDVVFSGEVET